MGRVEELERRVIRLESMIDAIVTTVNKIMDDVYEPGFIRKLDAVAERLDDEGPEA